MICGKAAVLSTSYPQRRLRLFAMGVLPGVACSPCDALGLKPRRLKGLGGCDIVTRARTRRSDAQTPR